MADGPTKPLWRLDTPPGVHPPLDEERSADVCVVGAGIAGLTTAYHLVRSGSNVLVVDAGTVGAGETARTTAHLVTALDRKLAEIERLRGADGLRLAVESHSQAIDDMEAIAAREAIDCDFSRIDGYLVGTSAEELEPEAAAAKNAGLTGVESVPAFEFGGIRGPALRFPRQGSFHPLAYLDGVARAIESQGGRICGSTRVTTFEVAGDRVRLETAAGHRIHAAHVVLATNSPIHRSPTIHTKQAAYRTYAIAARIERGQLPDVLVWDTLDPFHYVRTAGAAGGEFLVVGGEDHKTGQDDRADARFDRLEEWARDRWPELRWEVRWSGQVMATIDGLALIGRDPTGGNVWVATGDSGNGMTHGTIAGRLLTDEINGRPNPWSSLYDPSRFPLRTIPDWATENLNVAAQLTRYLAPSEADPPAGSGVVVRRGLRPVACYRDADGVIHERSAICPHLGCVVAWNAAESSWDCPCHGSRFDPQGCVLTGPAASDLARLDDDAVEGETIPAAKVAT